MPKIIDLFKKPHILISIIALLLAISYVGTTGSYTYKSLEDCILIRSANNSSALMLAKVQCEKEIKVEYEKMKTKFSYRFKDAEEEGHEIFDIYEYLANKSTSFLSIGSFKNGFDKIMSKQTDNTLANIIRGALIGGVFWIFIGFFIDYRRGIKSE